MSVLINKYSVKMMSAFLAAAVALSAVPATKSPSQNYLAATSLFAPKNSSSESHSLIQTTEFHSPILTKEFFPLIKSAEPRSIFLDSKEETKILNGREQLKQFFQTEVKALKKGEGVKLGGIVPNKKGKINFSFTPDGKEESVQASFQSTGMEGEVELRVVQVQHPVFESYQIIRVRGKDKERNEKVRYYDFPRDKSGKIAFPEKNFNLPPLSEGEDQRYWLKWLLESANPGSALKKGEGVKLGGIVPDTNGNIHFSFTPDGKEEVIRPNFQSTGMEGEVELRVVQVQHPVFESYQIIRVRGKDKERNEKVRYYDFPRDKSGKIAFSEKNFHFNYLSEGEDQRYWLKWLLESANSGSALKKSEGVELSGIGLDKNGNISFSFTPDGKEEIIRASFQSTGMVGEVVIRPFVREKRVYFAIVGFTASGAQIEKIYRYQSPANGWEGVKRIYFPCISTQWVGNRNWNNAMGAARELMQQVAQQYQIVDMNLFLRNHPALVRGLIQQVAKEQGKNAKQLERFFWRHLMQVSFYESFGSSGNGSVDSGEILRRRGATTQDDTLKGEEELARLLDPEIADVLAYAKYRDQVWQDGGTIEEIRARAQIFLENSKEEQKGEAKLLKELLFLESERARNKKILAPGFDLDAYQWEGIAKAQERKSVIWADALGLGKSIQVLVTGLANPENQKIVIVGPKAGLSVYLKEMAKHLQVPLKVSLLTGEKNFDFSPYHREGLDLELINQEKENFLQKWFEEESDGRTQILLTNYEQLVGREELFGKLRESGHTVGLLIVDEAQKVKNEESLRTQAVSQVPHRNLIWMSGTIVDNMPVDLYLPLKMIWESLSEEKRLAEEWQHLNQLASGGYLESEEAFSKLFAAEAENGEEVRQEYLEQLREVLAEVMIRRRPAEVMQRKLPQQKEERVSLDIRKGTMLLGDEVIQLGAPEVYLPQLRLYEKISQDKSLPAFARRNYLEQVLSDPRLIEQPGKDEGEERIYIRAIREHIAAVEEEFRKKLQDWPSIKQDAVKKLREKSNGHRLTLFSKFVGVVDSFVAQAGAGVSSQLNGKSVSLAQRQETIERFQEGEMEGLALTYGVGGTAVDLSLSNGNGRSPAQEDWVIVESIPDKGAVLRQGIGRLVRRSQDNRDRSDETVRVHKLIVTGLGEGWLTIDERNELICRHKDLLAEILENGVPVWEIWQDLTQIEQDLNRRVFMTADEEEDEEKTTDSLSLEFVEPSLDLATAI